MNTTNVSHGFVFTKPTMERVLRAREETRQIQYRKRLLRKRQIQYRKRLLRKKLETVTTQYIEHGGSKNFLSQLEHKMGKNVKGEGYMNFNRRDFIGWIHFVENAHIYPEYAHPSNTLRLFLVYLKDEGYILPQVDCVIWNHESMSVKFSWDDTASTSAKDEHVEFPCVVGICEEVEGYR